MLLGLVAYRVGERIEYVEAQASWRPGPFLSAIYQPPVLDDRIGSGAQKSSPIHGLLRAEVPWGFR